MVLGTSNKSVRLSLPEYDSFMGILSSLLTMSQAVIEIMDDVRNASLLVVPCDLIAKFNEIFERNNPLFEQWRLHAKS